MRKNIEFSANKKTTDVVVWSENGRICYLPYANNVEEIHQKFGGKQYYSSVTGSSGAGYITSPMAKIFKSYRTDCMTNTHDEQETLGRIQGIWFPYDYNNVGSNDYVIVRVYDWEKEKPIVVFLSWEDQTNEILSKIREKGKEGVEELPFLIYDKEFVYHDENGKEEKVEYSFACGSDCSKYKRELAKMAVNFIELKHAYEDEDKNRNVNERFYSVFKLKIDLSNNSIFKILPTNSGFVVSDVYNNAYEILANPEKFPEIFGHDCEFIHTKLYSTEFISIIMDQWDGETLVFTYAVPQENHPMLGVERVYEFETRNDDLFFLFDLDYIIEESSKWIRGNIKSAIADKKSIQELKMELENFTYRIVRFEDSLECGNCAPGTSSFSEKYLGGEKQACVSELVKYIENAYVKKLLVHMLNKWNKED